MVKEKRVRDKQRSTKHCT